MDQIMNEETRKKVVRFFKALQSRTRIIILEILINGASEPNVTVLASKLGQTEANVSAQIKKLEKVNLITCKYESGEHGVQKIPSLTDFGMKLLDIVKTFVNSQQDGEGKNGRA
jgi:predicted transcriptional regulator